jgi:hypothetical protein
LRTENGSGLSSADLNSLCYVVSVLEKREGGKSENYFRNIQKEKR